MTFLHVTVSHRANTDKKIVHMSCICTLPRIARILGNSLLGHHMVGGLGGIRGYMSHVTVIRKFAYWYWGLNNLPELQTDFVVWKI